MMFVGIKHVTLMTKMKIMFNTELHLVGGNETLLSLKQYNTASFHWLVHRNLSYFVVFSYLNFVVVVFDEIRNFGVGVGIPSPLPHKERFRARKYYIVS